MEKFEVLKKIFISFMHFSNDFRLKKENKLELFYAMDNDVFNFSLLPKRKVSYVDLLEDNDKKFLNYQAIQMALSLKKLANKQSVFSLPSHALEYKDTIFYLFSEANELKETINKTESDVVSKILDSKNDYEEIIKILEQESPEILKMLINFDEFKFAKKQLDSLINSNINEGIQPFKNLLNNEILDINKIFENIDIDLATIIKENKNKNGSPLALNNDIKALRLVIAFNKKSKIKKIILITGDHGIHKAYEEYHKEYLDEDEIYAVRYPKYFIPFLSGNNSLFSDKNEKIVNNIGALFDNIFETSDENFEEESIEVIKELKSIINLNNIDDIDDIDDSNNLNELISLLKKKDFKEYLSDKIEESVEFFKHKLYLIPLMEEILKHQEYAKGMKYFFRFPFVVSTSSIKQKGINNDQQDVIDKFTKDILHGKLSKEIIKIQEKFSDYHKYLLNASVVNLLYNSEKALGYIKAAKEAIQDDENINESYLLESFIYRTNIKSYEDFLQSKKALNNIKEESEFNIFRKKIEISLLDTTLLLINKLDNNIEIPNYDEEKRMKDICSNLKNLISEYSKIKHTDNKLSKRAKVQIYINILTIYLFNKYFLNTKIVCSFTKDFFIDNKEIYTNNLGHVNKIGFMCVMIKMLKIEYVNSPEEIKLAKYDAIKCITDLLTNQTVVLLNYEDKLLRGFLKSL
jgi:hypothetical protein